MNEDVPDVLDFDAAIEARLVRLIGIQLSKKKDKNEEEDK